jgi:hypothetical protein
MDLVIPKPNAAEESALISQLAHPMNDFADDRS